MKLPEPGAYGVAMCFLLSKGTALAVRGRLRAHCPGRSLTLLGWRDTPVNGDAVGARHAPPNPTSSSFSSVGLSGWRKMPSSASFTRFAAGPKTRLPLRRSRTRRRFMSLVFLPDHRLQGPDAGAADREVLFRAGQSARHQRTVLVTNGSPPIRFRAGSSRTLIAMSRTTERSIPFAET